MKNYTFLLLVALFLFNCNSEDVTPLPQEIIIQITNKNLDEGKYELLGTQILDGHIGEWSVISVNNIQGEFSNDNRAITTFTGSIYERYRIQWKVSNGEEEKTGTLDFRMSAGQAICDNLIADRNIERFLELYTLDQIIRLNCYELINGNYVFYRISPLELFEAGVPLSDLLDHPFYNPFNLLHIVRLSDLLNEMTLLELYESVLTLNTFYYSDPNYLSTAQHMTDEGVTVNDLLNAGVTYQDLLSGDYTLQQLLDAGVTIDDMLNAGVPITDLTENLTLTELWNTGELTLKQLIFTNKFSTTDILEDLNLSAATLISEGIIEEVVPSSGLYVLKYFHNVYNTLLLTTINNLITDMNTWRLPTMTECQLIYDNRVALDLQTDNTFLYSNDTGDFFDTPYYYWLTTDESNTCSISGVVTYPLEFSFSDGSIGCSNRNLLTFPLYVLQM